MGWDHVLFLFLWQTLSSSKGSHCGTPPAWPCAAFWPETGSGWTQSSKRLICFCLVDARARAVSFCGFRPGKHFLDNHGNDRPRLFIKKTIFFRSLGILARRGGPRLAGCLHLDKNLILSVSKRWSKKKKKTVRCSGTCRWTCHLSLGRKSFPWLRLDRLIVAKARVICKSRVSKLKSDSKRKQGYNQTCHP